MLVRVSALFQRSAVKKPESFARLSAAERGVDWPRLVVKVTPLSNSLLGDDSSDTITDSSTDSIEHALTEKQRAHATPFSHRTVIYDDQEVSSLPGVALCWLLMLPLLS